MTKKSTPAGIAGNAERYTGIPLRQFASASYGASDGRAVSSLADQNGRGSPSTTHAVGVSRQYTDAFDAIDKRRTQNKTPVRERSFTTKNEG